MAEISGRLPVKVHVVGSDGESGTLESLVTATGDAEDAANDPTVIGLLKQVIVKLDEVKTAIEGLGG